MAIFCLYLNPNPLFPFSSSSSSSSCHSLLSTLSPSKFHGDACLEMAKERTPRKRKIRDIALYSVHSNPRILKSNRKTPYGKTLTPYADDNDDDDQEDEHFEEASELSDDDSTEIGSPIVDFRTDQKSIISFSPHDRSKVKRGTWKPPKMLGHEESSLEDEESLKPIRTNVKSILEKGIPRDTHGAKIRLQRMDSVGMDGRGKLQQTNEQPTRSAYQQLSEDLDFDEKWFPLIDYLTTFGLKESHFIQMYERHMPCLQINVTSARDRLNFLLSVGVKHRDIRKILLRQPQILEYTVEKNLKAHVAFLVGLGIPDSRVGQIITAAPSLFSYSVEQSLKPTIRYLIEEVGIKKSDVSKVVQLSPQILVQRIDNSWTSRYGFLSKELGAPKDSIVKMVMKHPQLLHYSIEDGILPRINFLRSIGMRNCDILKILTSLTQVLSLSLEDNLKPKYLYLVNELHNEVKSLTKYPTYLSLSLEQRIRPRHRFLVALKKAPKGPFPLSSFVPTDESFCQQWAGTSLDKYLAFRQSLLLSQFAQKYGRK